MNTEPIQNHFLNVLLNLKDYHSNPFFSTYSSAAYPKWNYNPFCFYEDLIEKEVRCPICLGRVKSAMKPNCCIHLFCSFCIKKWNKVSKKLSVCRREMTSLAKVDISQNNINCQMDLFI